MLNLLNYCLVPLPGKALLSFSPVSMLIFSVFLHIKANLLSISFHIYLNIWGSAKHLWQRQEG